MPDTQAAIAVLQVEQNQFKSDLSETKILLKDHVEGCARLQKWVLGVLVFIAGLVASDSPKAAKLLGAVMSVLG